MIRRLLATAAVLLVLVSCQGEGKDDPSPTTPTIPSGTPVPPSATGATTTPPSPLPPPATASPRPTTAAFTASCVSGWETPKFQSALWNEGVGILRSYLRLKTAGKLVVNDIRYFEGPESPPIEKGYLANVRRWYVKGYLERDDAFRGRWLAESREWGNGVVAAAAYDSTGFSSPDWIGFQYEGADAPEQAYPGLAGTWRGHAYDFVNGGGDDGVAIPGLPEEVAGCLHGT